MKYLNLGCGYHYSKDSVWTNLDFESTGDDVLAHNLLQGVPFGDNSFDLVYHSHVLEHFTKIDGEKFMAECLRVLKPGGILRIAIPDLEMIVRNYLKYLEEGWKDNNNTSAKTNYEWMLLEMYDQTVRNKNGGEMGAYLSQEEIPNEEFVFSRIGEEGKAFRKMILAQQKNNPAQQDAARPGILAGIKGRIREIVFRIFNIDANAFKIGQFRLGGEIHQWMYDRYSLRNLLQSKGASAMEVRDAFSSYANDWASYQLDAIDGIVRKPDSLFMEAIKK